MLFPINWLQTEYLSHPVARRELELSCEKGTWMKHHHMPSDFHCSSCQTGFSVGWFHYHEVVDGFGAETQLVCSACGTMHRVRHPGTLQRGFWENLFSRSASDAARTKVQLQAQAGPCHCEPAAVKFGPPLEEWIPCPVTHDLTPSSKHDYMKGYIALETVPCHHCHQTGTLTEDWSPHILRCPACGEATLVHKQSWMT